VGLGLRLRGRGGADDTEVASATDLDALADRLRDRLPSPGSGRPLGLPGLGNGARLWGPLGPPNVTHDVRQRLEVVSPFLGRVRRQPDHVPAARHHEPRGVHLAQIP
jgi:hypothetical protein